MKIASKNYQLTHQEELRVKRVFHKEKKGIIMKNERVIEKNPEHVFYDIPGYSGYSITMSGDVWKERWVSHKGGCGYVGTKYDFSRKSLKTNKYDILKLMFGEEVSDNFLKRKKHDPKEKNVWKTKTLELWYSVSGETSDYQNYFNFFDITIDQIVDNINVYIMCDNCVTVTNAANLTIDWSDVNMTITTDDFLSFNLLRYFYHHHIDGSVRDKGNFSIKSRLTKEEYATWGMVIHNIFKINFSTTYGIIEDDESDDILVEFKHRTSTHQFNGKHEISEKRKVSDEDEGFEVVKVDYSLFEDFQKSGGLEEWVFSNLKYYRQESGINSHRVGSFEFNQEFRNLLRINNNRFTPVEIFCEYCEYYFKLEFGIKRLDLDLMKMLIKYIV
jgi:hypothetical protein